MQQLLTPENLVTQGGLTMLAFVVPNALREAFGWSAKWIGFVTALVACFAVTFGVADPSKSSIVLKSIVAFGNACLVFLAARGGTASIHGGAAGGSNSGGSAGAITAAKEERVTATAAEISSIVVASPFDEFASLASMGNEIHETLVRAAALETVRPASQRIRDRAAQPYS